MYCSKKKKKEIKKIKKMWPGVYFVQILNNPFPNTASTTKYLAAAYATMCIAGGDRDVFSLYL